MSKFNHLKVQTVVSETHDAVSVSFEVPDNLLDNYHYKPGQYTTLRLHINGETVNRSYSFCSSPYTGEEMTIAVKRVAGGKGSNFVNDVLKPGMEIEVMEPMGNFHTELNSSNEKHYVLFAGGSGITPVFSILKSVLQKEPSSQITLFYGNRDSQSIIFRKQLDAAAEKYHDRLKVVYILDKPENGWKGYTGFVVKDMALKLLRENTDLNFRKAEFFICGPVPMMKEVESAISILGIDKEHIHIEYFTAKADEDKKAADVGAGVVSEIPFTGKTRVKIIWDGKTAEFDVTERQTILHAALDAGLDPPYSCMVAACCTCRAKLISGKVEMDDREALTDAELSKGYVLTCQSHAKSNGIVLNYDL